jgi:hypothetical protein
MARGIFEVYFMQNLRVHLGRLGIAIYRTS